MYAGENGVRPAVCLSRRARGISHAGLEAISEAHYGVIAKKPQDLRTERVTHKTLVHTPHSLWLYTQENKLYISDS